jgi:hypothetical protein
MPAYAPDRLREVAARNFQQLTSATADIQPPLLAQIQAGAFQELLHQKPFPAVKMEGILGESIPDRIIEQLRVRGRVLVEFRANLLVSLHCFQPSAP